MMIESFFDAEQKIDSQTVTPFLIPLERLLQFIRV
jgi:hypothetical protein